MPNIKFCLRFFPILIGCYFHIKVTVQSSVGSTATGVRSYLDLQCHLPFSSVNSFYFFRFDGRRVGHLRCGDGMFDMVGIRCLVYSHLVV